jgi:hypothetical protein
MKRDTPTIPSLPTTAISAAEQGHDRGGGEIDVAHLKAGLVKHLTERHRDPFQMREEARVFLRWQGSEKVILARVRGRHTLPMIGHDRTASATWLNRMFEATPLRMSPFISVRQRTDARGGLSRFVGMVAQREVRAAAPRFVLATVA